MSAPPPPPAPTGPPAPAGPPPPPSATADATAGKTSTGLPLKFTRKKNKPRPTGDREERISETPLPASAKEECAKAFLEAAQGQDGLDKQALEALFWRLDLDDSDMSLDTFFKEDTLLKMAAFEELMSSRPFIRGFLKRTEMQSFLSQHLAIGSRCRILDPDANLSDILPKSQPIDPSTCVVGFDFDQTVTYVDRKLSKDGKKVLAIRGGDKSKQCLLQLKERKVPLVLITAQPPTQKTLYSLRNELHELGLSGVFDVEKIDPVPIWSTVKSWGSDQSMSLSQLSKKLLLLILLNSDRFVENVSRIGYSRLRVEYQGEDTHPAWRWRVSSDDADGQYSADNYSAATRHPASIHTPDQAPPAISRIYYQTANTLNPMMHAEDLAPSGWSGALTLLPSDFTPSEANVMDSMENLFRRQLFTLEPSRDVELCPVRCLHTYILRTLPIRPVLEWKDTEEESKFREDSPNRLLLFHGDTATTPATPCTKQQLEEMLLSVFTEAKVPEHSARDLVEDRAKEITNYKEVKLAHLGNTIASRHNKPEALELFMELRGLKPSTIFFVDDNSDNVFNVFTHFAQREIDQVADAPSIHTFWFTPPVRAEEANPGIKWTMRKLHESYKE
eukprot:gb/GEZN01002478.1/.p1 GENE.gb/GEZN01002478.1/~~gb/GEZN01002478.1/.p1  ORF type:complete len:617 (-),score=114.49 gb/GEZN01002478.1/:539-2389(-)